METKFAENLKLFRRESALSQSQLGALVGCSQKQISSWEKGQREPSLIIVWKLADIFDVPIDVLVGRKDY